MLNDKDTIEVPGEIPPSKSSLAESNLQQDLCCCLRTTRMSHSVCAMRPLGHLIPPYPPAFAKGQHLLPRSKRKPTTRK